MYVLMFITISVEGCGRDLAQWQPGQVAALAGIVAFDPKFCRIVIRCSTPMHLLPTQAA